MPDARRRIAAAALALVAAGCVLLLGHAVGRAPDPAVLMRLEHAWVNHSTLVAWWITWCGYAYVLAPLAVVTIVVAVRYPAWRPRVIFAIVALLLAWRGADLLQHIFMRPRRLDWVVKHETSFSFPSSHAAVSTGFYLLWSMFIARSSLRYRAMGASLLALLTVAIWWSRLALGAHYLTDILGGALWAVAVIAALAAALPINVFEGPRATSLE